MPCSVKSVDLDPSTVTRGGTTECTVSLAQVADRDYDIELTYDKPAALKDPPDKITISTNTISSLFDLDTDPNTTETSVIVSAKCPGGTDKQATLTITV